jgi:hypothetical protein
MDACAPIIYLCSHHHFVNFFSPTLFCFLWAPQIMLWIYVSFMLWLWWGLLIVLYYFMKGIKFTFYWTFINFKQLCRGFSLAAFFRAIIFK